MMHRMMHKFFTNMSRDDRRKMVCGMMPKMMFGTMGRHGWMKFMKENATGDKKDGDEKEDWCEEFDPMDIFFKIMTNMEKSSELATYATPEVRALFEEWVEQIENEILNYIKETNTTDPVKLAEQFKLSKNSINFFLSKLAQKNKINLKAEKI